MGGKTPNKAKKRHVRFRSIRLTVLKPVKILMGRLRKLLQSNVASTTRHLLLIHRRKMMNISG